MRNRNQQHIVTTRSRVDTGNPGAESSPRKISGLEQA
jgi:hypothetical protein